MADVVNALPVVAPSSTPDSTGAEASTPDSQSPVQALASREALGNASEEGRTPAPAVQDPKSAIASRMARFKALQAKKIEGLTHTTKAVTAEKRQLQTDHKKEELDNARLDNANFKLLREDEGEAFERKLALDYTVEENDMWEERQAKKRKNKDDNVFSNYSKDAEKTYDKQIKKMGKVDLKEYALKKAKRIHDQVASGVLVLQKDDYGQLQAYNPVTGQINVPAEEDHMKHKATEENVDKIVAWEEKREQARLEARRKRMGKDDDGGDVTYINEKNKQFNNKLNRFYNKYTTETRENFERGTAI